MSIVLAFLLVSATPVAGAPSAELSSKRVRLTNLRAGLAVLDRQAAIAAVEHNRALDRLDSVKARLRRTNADLVVSRRQHRLAQRRLAVRLSAAYRRPPPSALRLLLSIGSLSKIQATGDAVSRVADLDAQTIAEARARQTRLRNVVRRLANERVVASEQLATAEARKRDVIRLVNQRRSAVARADTDLRQALVREQQRLVRLAELKRAGDSNSRIPVRRGNGQAPTSPTTGGAKGRAFPISGPTNFSDDWLASRPGGRLHEGIDLFAKRGTPAVAIADGTLFRVGWNRLGGWRLWLRDDAGTEYYYAHLDAFATAAREGARVTAGTVIGYVGDSGDAKGTSPHVHFEIHPGGGVPVRPYPIVAGLPRV